jgi:hypothetical protein
MRAMKRALSAPLSAGFRPMRRAIGQETDMRRSIRPLEGNSTPPSMRISVDLPAPLRPRMPSRSPGRITAVAPRRIQRFPPPRTG